jgi:hypothetical protein
VPAEHSDKHNGVVLFPGRPPSQLLPAALSNDRYPVMVDALLVWLGEKIPNARCHFRCWARYLFISNMVTLSLPNTLPSLSSARISRRSSGFCRLWERM